MNSISFVLKIGFLLAFLIFSRRALADEPSDADCRNAYGADTKSADMMCNPNDHDDSAPPVPESAASNAAAIAIAGQEQNADTLMQKNN